MKSASSIRTTVRPTRGDFASRPVFAFWIKNQNSLWHVARFLGGYEAARLVDRISVLLEYAQAVDVRSRPMLEQLASVLNRQAVHEPGRVQLSCFAVIDPEDPVIEEIRHLETGLTEALEEFDARRAWIAQQAATRTTSGPRSSAAFRRKARSRRLAVPINAKTPRDQGDM